MDYSMIPFYFLASVGMLFIVLFLHELGHYVAARLLGMTNVHIGIFRNGSLPTIGVGYHMDPSPWKKLFISSAGPAVNIICALVTIRYLGALVVAFGPLLWIPAAFCAGSLIVGIGNLLPYHGTSDGDLVRAAWRKIWSNTDDRP